MPSSSRSTRAQSIGLIHGLGLFSVTLLALVLRLPADRDRFFWGDEAWRAYFLYNTDSVADIPAMSHRISSWLQLSEYAFGKIGILLFGDLSLSLLVWPMIWGVLAVLGAYHLLTRFCGRPQALVGSLLIAIGPGFILHSREFKPYALDLALTFWALIMASGPESRPWSRRHDILLLSSLSIFAVSSLIFVFVFPPIIVYRLYQSKAIRWLDLARYSIPGWLFLGNYFLFLRAQNLSRSEGFGPFTRLQLNRVGNLSHILDAAATSIPTFIVLGWLVCLISYFFVMPAISAHRGDGVAILLLGPFIAQSILSMLGKYPMFMRPSTYLFGLMIIGLVYGFDGLRRFLASRFRTRRHQFFFAALVFGFTTFSVWATGPPWSRLMVASAHPEDPGKRSFQLLASLYKPGDKIKFGFGYEFIFLVHKEDAFKDIPKLMAIGPRKLRRLHRLGDRSADQLCNSFQTMSQDLLEGDRVWILSRRIQPYQQVLKSLGKLELLIAERRQGLMLLSLEKLPATLDCPEWKPKPR